MKKNTSAPAASARTTAPSLPSITDRFEAMGAHGIWVVLGIAMLMVAYVYWDYLTLAKVLLYTDIGSDSVNYYYPAYVQMARQWAETGGTSFFSLETAMGMPTNVNIWDPSMLALMWAGPDNVPYVIAVVEAAKMLLATMFTFFTFRMQGLRNTTSAIGALCVGFCGYAALFASGWYNLSHEVLLLAAALWAVEYAFNRRPVFWLVLPITIVVLAHNSYVFIVYLVAMLLAYLVVRVLEHSNWQQLLRPAGLCTALIIAGLALSYDQLDTLRTLVTDSGRAESITKSGAVSAYGTNMTVGPTEIADGKERTNIILRAYSGAMMGTGNAYKGMMNFLEGPLLYYGLAMLLFTPLFLVTTDKRRRIVFGCLLAGLLVLTFFPWFRFAFWGFNLDYFREYTLLIGTALLVMSMRGLDMFSAGTATAAKWIPAATAVVAMMILQGVGSSATDVDPAMRSTVTALLVGFAAIAVAYTVTRRNAVLLGFVVLTVVDLTINADATINNRKLLTVKQIEQGVLYGDDTRKAVDWIKQHDAGLYRIAKLDASGPAMHQSLNDAMVMGFNGLIGYQSNHNKYYLRFMDAMGLLDRSKTSDAKWVFRAMFQPYLSSLLGVKYFVRRNGPVVFDDQHLPGIKQVGNAYIHESSMAMPLLIAYDSYITPDQLASLPPIRREVQLFKSVVLDTDVAVTSGLRPYPLTADTTSPIRPADVAALASTRRSMMSVNANATQYGISARIVCNHDALVVASIPYDKSLILTVDGKQVQPFVANVGLVGFKVRAGTHVVEINKVLQ